MIRTVDLDMEKLRRKYIKNAIRHQDYELSDVDLVFLAADTKSTVAFVKETVNELRRKQ